MNTLNVLIEPIKFFKKIRQALASYILLPRITDEMIAFGVPIYGALLLSMVWCAISRAQNCIQMFSAVSAASFAVSDFIIVVNLFYQPLVYSQVHNQSRGALKASSYLVP